MSRHRVLIDIEFFVDDDEFKIAQLDDDPTGVSDVTAAGVRDAVAGGMVETNWLQHGLTPLRCVVTTRALSQQGDYEEVLVPAESSINRG